MSRTALVVASCQHRNQYTHNNRADDCSRGRVQRLKAWSMALLNCGIPSATHPIGTRWGRVQALTRFSDPHLIRGRLHFPWSRWNIANAIGNIEVRRVRSGILLSAGRRNCKSQNECNP